MNPTKFKQANKNFGENQPEYIPLPGFLSMKVGEAASVTTCWKPTLRERLRLIFRPRIYVTQITFGQPLQPLAVQTKFNPPILRTDV